MALVRRCFLLGLGLGSADAFAIGGTGLMRASRLMSMSAAKRAPLDGAVETPIPLTTAATIASTASAAEFSGDLLVLPFYQVEKDDSIVLDGAVAELDAKVGGAVADMIADAEFKGGAGASAMVTLPRGTAARRIAVVGLGKADDFKQGGARKLGAALATMAVDQKVKTMGAVLPAVDAALQQATVEAALLGLSPDTRYKSKGEGEDEPDDKLPKLESLALIGADEAAIERASVVASGVLLTRGMVASPPNYMTPSTMAETAASVASDFDTMTLKVLEREECEALGMGAYLGVSQGACEPPKLIHLVYAPAGGATKRVALVGKGLTFDSGGYNIKAGAASMIEKMKFDMGGAGAVLGASRVVAGLAPEGVEVHFIIAACENMVSAEAMRPGDILTASNGKTIEVINTDAEGRLTLADALVYAEGVGKLDAVVDVATLTGACIVALGPEYGGLWSDNDDVAAGLLASAEETGELLWRMPLAKEYADQLKST